MDAKTRKPRKPKTEPTETVKVVISGREVELSRPDGNQMLGLQMAMSPKMPEGSKVKAIIALMMAILPTDDDREWFMLQFISGGAKAEDLAKTLQAIATAEQEPAS